MSIDPLGASARPLPQARPQGTSASSDELRDAWAASDLHNRDSEGPSESSERRFIVHLTGEGNFDRARDAIGTEGVPTERDAIVNELLRVNARSMGVAAPALEALASRELLTDVNVLPLSNTLVVSVPAGAVDDAIAGLRAVPGVGNIVADRKITLDDPGVTGEGDSTEASRSTAWNVYKVNAPDLWEQGVRGKGVTVGIIDSGVDVGHEALTSKYRGYGDDKKLNNEYNFVDFVNSKSKPYDDNDHGTHVAGTVVGGTSKKAIGMAPDARWIAAKALDSEGSGYISDMVSALEWMVAPRDANGKNPDPAKAPDIINNSWSVGDDAYDGFRGSWRALHEAGIITVSSAGNSGPNSGTLGSPGSYPEGVTVGATNDRDQLADFSSRGPSPWSGAENKSPDISAPGVSIESARPGGGYQKMSGTSMSSPGAAGVIALLLSQHPDLTSDEVVQVLTSTAVDVGDPGYGVGSGYGRIDAEAALAAADKLVAERN